MSLYIEFLQDIIEGWLIYEDRTFMDLRALTKKYFINNVTKMSLEY
jgi:hypothetical protein